MPLVSVVLTTHNDPRALELVLEGYRRQEFTDFEVVLGDDGSREETRVARGSPALPSEQARTQSRNFPGLLRIVL